MGEASHSILQKGWSEGFVSLPAREAGLRGRGQRSATQCTEDRWSGRGRPYSHGLPEQPELPQGIKAWLWAPGSRCSDAAAQHSHRPCIFCSLLTAARLFLPSPSSLAPSPRVSPDQPPSPPCPIAFSRCLSGQVRVSASSGWLTAYLYPPTGYGSTALPGASRASGCQLGPAATGQARQPGGRGGPAGRGQRRAVGGWAASLASLDSLRSLARRVQVHQPVAPAASRVRVRPSRVGRRRGGPGRATACRQDADVECSMRFGRKPQDVRQLLASQDAVNQDAAQRHQGRQVVTENGECRRRVAALCPTTPSWTSHYSVTAIVVGQDAIRMDSDPRRRGDPVKQHPHAAALLCGLGVVSLPRWRYRRAGSALHRHRHLHRSSRLDRDTPRQHPAPARSKAIRQRPCPPCPRTSRSAPRSPSCAPSAYAGRRDHRVESS